MASILEVKHLTHIYGEDTPFRSVALNDVSFTIEKGSFVGLIGHTGSGKSTLIQHLNGLLKPSSGQILLDNRDIWSDKQYTRQTRFRVGLVFQYPEYQLFEETVYKDIAFGPKNMGLNPEEIKKRVLQASEIVGLKSDVLDCSPFELSGGQKRRAAIAGVLAMQPEILILDEPTAGLDPLGCSRIMENILDYQRTTLATIIMVSHSMEEVALVADRLMVMNHGVLAMDGTPHQVFSRAKELLEMGLNVPQITGVFMRLRELGLDIDPSIYTIEQAKETLLKQGGKQPC